MESMRWVRGRSGEKGCRVCVGVLGIKEGEQKVQGKWLVIQEGIEE